jgi:protease I
VDLKEARIVYVVAPRFKDDEYRKSRGVLERRGCKIKVAARHVKDCFGLEGAKAKVEIPLDQVDMDCFDALVLVGGLGMKDFWKDEQLFGIIRSAHEKGRVIGAIDIAPVLLAQAGILEGKKVTVYFSESKAIASAGAEYLTKSVVVDGNIITGKGSEASEDWAVEITKALLQR